MKYLVTGGAGFIGSHIADALVESGESVRVLDNLSTGKLDNLRSILDRIEMIEGDLRDAETVRQAVSGVDYVLHQGALPSVPRSIADPVEVDTVNVMGTLNVLVAARDEGVKRVVYASSSAVYGDAPVLPKTEKMKPEPKSPYAVSKLAAEQYCHVFTEVYGLETVSLRYFNVFGPRQDPASQYAAVIPIFITALLEGRSPVVYGDGLQSRDFCFVANNVDANLLACTVPHVAEPVLNVACGKRCSLLELLAVLRQYLEADTGHTHDAARPGDVRHSLADISRAQRVLGYRPKVDLQQGLRRTVAWYAEASGKAGDARVQ